MGCSNCHFSRFGLFLAIFVIFCHLTRPITLSGIITAIEIFDHYLDPHEGSSARIGELACMSRFRYICGNFDWPNNTFFLGKMQINFSTLYGLFH